MYEDLLCRLYLQIIEGRLFLHVDVIPQSKPSLMKHYDVVLGELENRLRERKVPALFTMVVDETTEAFAAHFGFQRTGEFVEDIDAVVMGKEL